MRLFLCASIAGFAPRVKPVRCVLQAIRSGVSRKIWAARAIRSGVGRHPVQGQTPKGRVLSSNGRARRRIAWMPLRNNASPDSESSALRAIRFECANSMCDAVPVKLQGRTGSVRRRYRTHGSRCRTRHAFAARDWSAREPDVPLTAEDMPGCRRRGSWIG